MKRLFNRNLQSNINKQFRNGMSDLKKFAFYNIDLHTLYDIRLKRTITVSLYSIIVGIVAGIGAVLFRYMISLFHNIFFLGQFSFTYDSVQHAVSPFSWWIIFIPAAGMVIVVFLTQTFAPEAKGHGVPEVMYSILEKGGKIRPVVSIVKSLASAISIGSGGSVGREGPIVQIGASFGSTLGSIFKLKPQEVITLVCAGVAGGIAATFNAPIGGVAFAIELMLPEFSILKLMPLVVASTVATAVSTHFIGIEPAFVIPSYKLVSSYEFIFYIILGFLAGFMAIGYIQVLYSMEDFVDKIKINHYVKGAVSGLLLGVCGYILLKTVGHYYIFGVGYSFITDALTNHSTPFLIILILIILKIIANSLTLAGGGSGGVFAPSLFIGIGVGALVGIGVNTYCPEISGPVSAYALVGMAAVVAGTTGAALTSIIMTFEMTRNYEIMLPLMLSVVVASFVTRFFYRESIYTKKLSRRGVSIQLDKFINIFKLTAVKEVAENNIICVKPGLSVEDTLSVMLFHNLTFIPVIKDNTCYGVVGFRQIYSEDQNRVIDDYIEKLDLYIGDNDDTITALKKMEANQLGILIIRDCKNEISGIVTRNRIIEKYFIKRKLLIG
jgi:CIC family chloride channel protein